MLLISHLGNIDAVLPAEENTPVYIDKAINLGYDVLINIVSVNNKLYLEQGNSDFNYEIPLSWLFEREESMWIHAKNFATLSNLITKGFKIFYQEKENHVIINNTNLVWSLNLTEANDKSIIPLLGLSDIVSWDKKSVYGICSDYVGILKEELK